MSFELIRERRIETLGVTVSEYEHRATGAMHFHLASSNPENVFMVALRTVPMDSTGVAHVLEHTALCGSERYPVRDPFFWMIRRSLNTFMNAFTTNDYTAYPFATQNRKDYFNLLDVYLDAVFFSRLEELDFAQEGIRVEFETPDDPESDLVYRGVVYNEMKGDTSSPISVLLDAMNARLYPTTTYHHNSGGDPAVIPSLTYEQLLAFYRTHYHPSNAVFMTYGDIPAAEQQALMETRVLSRFDALPGRIEVGREQRLTAPVSVETAYAVDEEEGTAGKTHIVVGWLLGDNTDLDQLLRLNLLSDALLDTAGSPLRQALESSPLAGALSPLTGLEETSREMSFSCGVEGSEPENAEGIERLILETLERVATEGLDPAHLEACLHQLELHQREIGGDGAPFGLQLIFSCMSAAIHRGDPIDLLDLDPAIERLRADVKTDGFIQRLVREQLLDNPHRVTVVMSPDPAEAERKLAREREALSTLKDNLDEEARQRLIDRAAALSERQASEDDVSSLPKVELDDIGDVRRVPDPTRSVTDRALPFDVFEAGTNGLVYHQIATRLPPLDIAEASLLPLFASLVTEIGSGQEGYIETQARQHRVTGGISAWSAFRPSVDDPDRLDAWFTVSSRTLNRQTHDMFELVRRTLEAPNFREPDRLRSLVRQARIRREASVTGNGHGLAMSAASAALRAGPRIHHQLSGLVGIGRIKTLDREFETHSDSVDMFVARLDAISQALNVAERRGLIVADAGFSGEAEALLARTWKDVASMRAGQGLTGPDFDPPPLEQAWLTTTQVNFCAQAHATCAETHPDSAALSVLAVVMRNGFLHGRLRERGGAYGGGATHDSATGVFRFYSYRDPNLMATFDAFDDCIGWAQSATLGFDIVEEAILGLVAGLDAPLSPAGDARQAFQNRLFGRTPEHRRQLRDNILAVREDDIHRVACEYLASGHARAVVTSERSARALPDSFTHYRV